MKAVTQNLELVVIGQVSLPSQARAIVAALRKAGHSERHVAVFPKDGLMRTAQHDTDVMDGAATGGVVGAVLGGMLGLLLGTSGTVALPALFTDS